MSSKVIDDKKRLVALAANLKEKFKRFRLGEADYEARMERQFKPLLKVQEQPVRERSSKDIKTIVTTIWGVPELFSLMIKSK